MKYNIDARTYSAMSLIDTLIRNQAFLITEKRINDDGMLGCLETIRKEMDRIVGFSLADLRFAEEMFRQWGIHGSYSVEIKYPEDWNSDENKRERMLG